MPYSLKNRISIVTLQKITVVCTALLFITVIAVFLLPLCAALIPNTNNPPALLRNIARITWFTFMQAFISAGCATLIGLSAAFFCARRTFFVRKILLSLSAVPLSIPPVVIALAFILFLGKNGLLNSCIRMFYGEQYAIGSILYSMAGILLVHTFYNFPIAMRTITSAWEQLPEETEQAAQLLGSSPLHIFCRIILPALIPAIASSFLLIFLYCFFSFVILLLLGGFGITSLEAELYRQIHTNTHSPAIPLIASIEISIALAIIFLYAKLRKKIQMTSAVLHYYREKKAITGLYERCFFAALMFIIIFFLVLPLGSLILYSLHNPKSYRICFTLRAWHNILIRLSFWKASLQTMTVGIATASLAVVTALFFMYLIYLFNIPAIQHIMPFLPIAVSSVILGAGWLRFGPYPSTLTLIAVQASLAWPFAWTQIELCFTKIPATVFEAAHLFSTSRTDAFFKLCIPLCKKGILSAFCSVFAISAGDASLPLVLTIPQFENIALLLFRYAGSYRFAESAAIATILAILTGSVFFLQEWIQQHYQ